MYTTTIFADCPKPKLYTRDHLQVSTPIYDNLNSIN